MIRLRDFNNADFDRGASRWREAAWMLIKAIFFLGAIPWPSSLRVALLRGFGARVGERVVVRSGVNVTFPWRVQIGDDVWLGEGTLILSLAPVVIESDVCISQRAFLCTGSHDYRKRTFDLMVSPITVHRGTWIAAQVFVAPGVTIGEASVLSAGAVVFDSVPARSLVQGNPAVVIKSLQPVEA